MRSDKESGEHLLTNGTGQNQCKREKVEYKKISKFVSEWKGWLTQNGEVDLMATIVFNLSQFEGPRLTSWN